MWKRNVLYIVSGATSALLFVLHVMAQGQHESTSMEKYTPSAVLANEEKLNGKQVTVEGTLENHGKNYFTDRRLVVTDGTSSGSALPVRLALPSNVPPAPPGQQASPATLSQYLGQKVILRGTLREDALRGFGKVKFLDVDSVRAIEK